MGFKSARNPSNTLFKQQLVANIYHDIFIFVETHCVQKETVEFNDYIVYSHNRLLNVNSRKGSGGIAIAFHKSVIECHTILSVYYGVDGQLAVKLRCNKTNIKLGVLGLYLSPDTYKYG